MGKKEKLELLLDRLRHVMTDEEFKAVMVEAIKNVLDEKEEEKE